MCTIRDQLVGGRTVCRCKQRKVGLQQQQDIAPAASETSTAAWHQHRSVHVYVCGITEESSKMWLSSCIIEFLSGQHCRWLPMHQTYHGYRLFMDKSRVVLNILSCLYSEHTKARVGRLSWWPFKVAVVHIVSKERWIGLFSSCRVIVSNFCYCEHGCQSSCGIVLLFALVVAAGCCRHRQPRSLLSFLLSVALVFLLFVWLFRRKWTDVGTKHTQVWNPAFCTIQDECKSESWADGDRLGLLL